MPQRTAGILLPIFSLPSPYGVGSLGESAREFVRFLHRAGQSWWQILPVGPAGNGDSPYQSASAHAGNPAFIDLELLAGEGLLTAEELASAVRGDEKAVDYPAVNGDRSRLLRLAFSRDGAGREKTAEFAAHQPWLEDYAVYQSVKDALGRLPWYEWPEEGLRRHEGLAIARWREMHREDCDYQIWVQQVFSEQWSALKSFANGLGVKILGDLPIYVSLDSADVWAEREQFLLDGEGRPAAVAGVPPDYFSVEGQLWGNPLYDWAHMHADGFGWWIRRVERAGELFDAIRIDHFRALASYWVVPAGAASAREGHWEPGPGMALVGVFTSWFPQLRFVAEDLGILTPDVETLLAESGLPGMRVLEFAFSGPDNRYLPHNCVPGCVLYTGTHDNAPLAGWEPSEEELAYAKRYLGAQSREDLNRRLLLAGQASVANTFIAQMQDYLGDSGRVNVPGTGTGNWRWRLGPGEASDALADEVLQMTEDAGRCPSRPC
ncbi:4-alpha-glucanotransferase [Oscillibacter sp. GMB15532]|uniref:4-alpha-glucanotransferase n=1 Tax=Oscillibacter sp. GMB15532 TaxID=3230022 RepID=UPI0034DE7474